MTAAGKNIAPVWLESLLCEIIEQAMVIGDNRNDLAADRAKLGGPATTTAPPEPLG